MFKKIIKVRNVGKLRKVDAAGDVEFRKLTLIFGENGRGKTTLCDILRSLKTGDGAYIHGRRSLAVGEKPEVHLLFDNSVVTYKEGSWTNAHPEIEIFDTAFVHNNVYAGDYVDHEHKRNLYRVIVGEEGVRLAREVDKLDQAIRESDRIISEKKSRVEKYVPEGVLFSDFLNFSADDNIDRRISEGDREVSALARADEIRAKGELQHLTLPHLPTTLAQVLSIKLDHVSADAEKLVQQHIKDKTIGATESWISEGLGYLKENVCPFCEQSVDSITLIEAYKSYFAEAYKKLKSNIISIKRQIEPLLQEATTLRLQQTISQNKGLVEFWSQFMSLEKPNLDLLAVSGAIGDLAESALNLIDQKLKAPLEPIQLGHEYSDAQARFQQADSNVATYNQAVSAVNALIRRKKEDTASGKLLETKAKLSRLKAIKVRYQDDCKNACTEYEGALREKKSLEKQKATAKKQLDQYSKDIFNRFERRINELLDLFGASFKIGGTKKQYLGGRPSSTYQVVIDGVGVELGDASTGIGEPSFRNTLSAGDRSTLALAFFIAQAELDPNLSNKILILDDPFSSQDRSRSTCTQQQINRLLNKCEQVIVMSHEPRFLRRIWDATDKSKVQSLQLTRIQENSIINPWNIEDETRGDYFRLIIVLKTFVNEGRGDLRNVAQTIRPVMEEYLRFNCPGSFADNEWLGDFLSKIEQATDGDPLYAFKDVLSDLVDIKDYDKRYHHPLNPEADLEPIDNGELASYASRTLRLVSAY